MANPQVEKLKALGLRHGEKAVVTLASLLCLLFLFKALTFPTIDITADQVASAAKQANASLDAKQSTEDILQKLEGMGIKEIGFEKVVDAQTQARPSIRRRSRPAAPVGHSRARRRG